MSRIDEAVFNHRSACHSQGGAVETTTDTGFYDDDKSSRNSPEIAAVLCGQLQI